MISLCIISRKEDQEALVKCIASCREYVGEVVVADTTQGGSMGPMEGVKIVPYSWEHDFSKARNFSFEQAKGDIVFWIDSDDVVRNPENLPKLAKLIEDGQADWIYMAYEYGHDEQGQVTALHWKPRLFRKDTVKWVKTVHEDAIPTTGVVQAKDADTGEGSVTVVHCPSSEEMDAHIDRNLGIMMDEHERDGEDTDPRTLQYIGFALEGKEEYRAAIPYYHRHVAKSGSPEDRFNSLIHLSRCLHETGDTRNAISVTMDSLKLFPRWKTAYLKLAELYYGQGEWEKCVEWTVTSFDKETPDTMDVINPLDFDAFPYARLAEAYLNLGKIREAMEAADILLRAAPKLPMAKEIWETCRESVELENYVRGFLTVAGKIRKYDRVKAARLFDLIPRELEDDVRIQEARQLIVPPKAWGDKSVTIFCGDSLEDWAYPSIFKGIGGSEEAVIMLSKELVKKGYQVTVYNRCGNMKGEYEGVNYLPYYMFDLRDSFNVLIGWRNPGLFLQKLKAKKKYLWLHDILYPEMINDRVIEAVDKVLFLSKWHSENVDTIPKDKIFITNNGISPDDFAGISGKDAHSAIYASSYDRGAVCLLRDIVPSVLKKIPDFHLHLCYGMQNLEKEKDQVPYLKEVYDEMERLIAKGEKEGWLTHHGRIPHLKLAKLMGRCRVWAYPTEFGETNCITLQKVQAAGCVPVTTDAGALPERMLTGHCFKGFTDIYSNHSQQQAFADHMIFAMQGSPGWTRDASKEAKELFSWEKTAEQWEKELL